MGQCKPIYGLKLDTFSKNMLKKIGKTSKLKKLLDSAAIAGTFNALFTKSGVGTAAVNIGLQDWNFLINATKSTGALQNNIIRRDIELAQVRYLGSTDYKLIQFWEGMANGCKY